MGAKYEYCQMFKPTKKGIATVKKAILVSKVNVYEPYDLFEITRLIQEYMPREANREVSKINYTSEIVKVVEYIKEHKLL
jgi:hypothetical protein